MGWYEFLRQYTVASIAPEGSSPTWQVLWLHIPNYINNGQMGDIINIPQPGNKFDPNDPNPYWKQDEKCAGRTVSDNCDWRWEEMNLVTFTP